MSQLSITVEPLTQVRFEEFGEVVAAPEPAGRRYLTAPALHPGGDMRLDVWCSRIEKTTEMPLIAQRMERHQFAAQTFVPLRPVRWLVIVAPKSASGLPDMAAARAFVPAPGQGVSFRPDVWHHPLAVFETPAEFYVSQWRFDDERDEEFVDIPLTYVVQQ